MGDSPVSFKSEYLHWVTIHTLVIAIGLGTYVVTSHLLHQRRNPSAAISWVISIFLLPYLAIPLFILLGARKVHRHPFGLTKHLHPVALPNSEGSTGAFQTLAAALGAPTASGYISLNIQDDGHEALASLMSVIQGAQLSLDVCTFVLGADVLGEKVLDALKAKSLQGVKVRLLIDGVGIYLGGKADLKSLRLAGAQVELFASPWRFALPGRTNLRNHRKMAIADSKRLWTGGRNLATEYFLGDETSSPPMSAWTDLTFEISGDLVMQAQIQFNQDWNFAIQAPGSRPIQTDDNQSQDGNLRAQFIPSGPDQLEDTVYSLLISSCFSAQRRIMAVSPYFVPDPTLLMALTLAARRGVEIDLVLPKRSNHRLADIARRTALRELAMAGARVRLFPSMIHAKVIVIDDQLALAGTANLDERSLFLNYELMIAFFDPGVVKQFTKWINSKIALTTMYKLERPGFLKELAEGVIRAVAFQL